MQHHWVLSVADLAQPKKKLSVVRDIVVALTDAGVHLVEDVIAIPDTATLSCQYGNDHFYADCVRDHYSAVPQDGRFAALPTFLREIFLLANSPLERHAHVYALLRQEVKLKDELKALTERVTEATELTKRMNLLQEQVSGLLAREAGHSLTRYMASRKRKRDIEEDEGESEDIGSSSSGNEDEDEHDLDSFVAVEDEAEAEALLRRSHAQKYPRLEPIDDSTKSRQPSPQHY